MYYQEFSKSVEKLASEYSIPFEIKEFPVPAQVECTLGFQYESGRIDTIAIVFPTEQFGMIDFIKIHFERAFSKDEKPIKAIVVK